MAAVRNSGGLEEALLFPLFTLLPAIGLGAVGGGVGAAVTRLRCSARTAPACGTLVLTGIALIVGFLLWSVIQYPASLDAKGSREAVSVFGMLIVYAGIAAFVRRSPAGALRRDRVHRRG